MEIINPEIVQQITQGSDIKILLNQKKIYFAYLNVQHSEMDKSVFGFDGNLNKTIPGYIKPNSQTIEMRVTKIFSQEAVTEIFKKLKTESFFSLLLGYKILYGKSEIFI